MVKHKRHSQRRPIRHLEKRPVNWPIIAGVIALGVIVLFSLLALSLRDPEIANLIDYCQDNPERCVAIGPADAPVTVVEVSDYGCPACRAFNVETAGAIEQSYVETGQVRWIVLPYARPSVKNQTGPAAEAALCANDQERFLDYHNTLFAMQESEAALTRDGYMQAAESLELDIAAFTSCLDSRTYQDTIEANIEAATLADVRATPTFFLAGLKLEGAQPFTVFQQRLEALLEG